MDSLPKEIRDRITVNKDTGCWEWVGVKLQSGYGVYNAKGKSTRAHRLVYAALFASPIRTDKWIKAEVKDRRDGRYWMFHDCGSPLWVSDHLLRKPLESQPVI